VDTPTGPLRNQAEGPGRIPALWVVKNRINAVIPYVSGVSEKLRITASLCFSNPATHWSTQKITHCTPSKAIYFTESSAVRNPQT